MICPNCTTELVVRPNDLLVCLYCPFTYTPNTKMVDEIFAWLSVDPKTRLEGIMTLIDEKAGKQTLIPLINSNIDSLTNLESLVKRARKNSGMKAVLVRFTRNNLIKEI